ncbi:sodium-translocating pyrophosphatase [Thermococci archaeon]|nr:MAG: sodium-translocating pyrophosphatase [Thermococci archaeon]
MGMELEASLACSILALIFAGYLTSRILRREVESKDVKEISSFVQEGAMAFLKREYTAIVPFVLVVSVLIAILISPEVAVSYLVGASCSALAGFIGMSIATRSNSRTVEAAKSSLNEALRMAFSGGTVMGMSVVGLGLLGVTLLYLLFKDPEKVLGFSFGASSIALFARVGGGIYTKGADVGADLVGKVEEGIPEDDPRNPGVIADNVGDNVGDVAGMGADLFESYVGAIIASMVIGYTISEKHLLYPLLIASVGILSSIMGTFFVRTGERADLNVALRRGVVSSSILAIVLSLVITEFYLGEIGAFIAILSGILVGVAIGLLTEYFTSYKYRPVREIAKASETGVATNILTGYSTGMLSTVLPLLLISGAIILSYHFSGLYGIAIAALGMLSTTGMTMSTDAYGPIADNAGGLAEMTKMGEEVRERTDALDALGNTTAAIGKGFAIGSAALTALALLSAYMHVAGLKIVNIARPESIVGLFIGAMLPFAFSALAIRAVGVSARELINEIRRQFREKPGILDWKEKPDYGKCVDISTKAAIRQMVLPGVTAVATPIIVGLILGKEALGALLIGAIATGFLLAIMMANAGGAWDNAKKYIEAGNLGGKGSDVHKASVVGDTVGDPFKDTAGPSLNILIKLMSIIALVFAPLF